MRNRRSPALTGVVLACLLLVQPLVSAQTDVSRSTEAVESSAVTAEGASVVSQGNGTHVDAKPKDTIAHVSDWSFCFGDQRVLVSIKNEVVALHRFWTRP